MKDQAHPTCQTCSWWSRNKQAKVGECNRSSGIVVRSANLDSTRFAYPRTSLSETCDFYSPKLK